MRTFPPFKESLQKKFSTRQQMLTLAGFAVAFAFVTFVIYILLGRAKEAQQGAVVRVMTYSSFMSAWGPGPELAKQFESQTGYRVEFVDAGDAGILLKKLEFFPADAVVGLDGLYLAAAEKAKKWREVKIANKLEKFIAIDWAPLAFVYHAGEITPPSKFADLLDARFRGAIALEDPRTSTPGLHFLNWLILEMGEAKAFEFLRALKPNVQSISPGWSGAYGQFTQHRAKLVFSYATSPIYHAVAEKDLTKLAAKFARHAVQTEYAAVPDSCQQCDLAAQFIEFLVSAPAQAIIMNKNFMLPIRREVASNSPFAAILDFPTYGFSLDSSRAQTAALQPEKIEELMAQWSTIEL